MESAVDLSVILAIEPQNFRAMLAGYQAIDQDFRTALLERHLPGLDGAARPELPRRAVHRTSDQWICGEPT
jgi:glucose-6-phosphate isomerase